MCDRALVGLILLHLASLSQAAEVRLRSSVACGSPIVRLADVAEIRDDDPALVKALGTITLCPAPATGSEQTLNLHEIRQILALTGIEPTKILVTGSDHVVLFADSPPVAARKTSIETGFIRQALYSVEAKPDRSSAPPKPTPIAPAPLTTAMKGVPLVERGAGVTIHSHKPGVRITTSGKAVQAGTAGALIAVELADSKQRVLARVVGPQVVELANATSEVKHAAP